MNKVFGLFSGAYSDWHCHGYYTTSEEAEKAAIQLSRNKDEYGCSENYYVVTLNCLDGINDVYKGNVIYKYNVTFFRYCSERDKDYTQSHPYISVSAYADDDFQLDKLLESEGVSEKLQDNSRIKTNPFWSDRLVCSWHNNRYMNEDEIMKVAYDMIAKRKAEKAGL